MEPEYCSGYIGTCRYLDGYFEYGCYGNCFGLRPVVEMNEGVYIASGSGTKEDSYVLAKEPIE